MDPGDGRQSVGYGTSDRLERAILNHRRRGRDARRDAARGSVLLLLRHHLLVSRRDPGHGFIRGGMLKTRGRSGAARRAAQRLAPNQCALAATADRCVISRASLRSPREDKGSLGQDRFLPLSRRSVIRAMRDRRRYAFTR